MTAEHELPIALPASCPPRTVITTLSNRWTLFVLEVLSAAKRPVRFGEFKRTIEGVSQKSLTKVLRTLERDGFLTRTVHATIPPRVYYALTPLGLKAGDLLVAVHKWARVNAGTIAESRTSWEAKQADLNDRPNDSTHAYYERPY